MICQQCMKKQANVQITQMINNQKTVIYLCEDCAEARQDLIIELPFNISNLLASIMGNMNDLAPMSIQEKTIQCKVCGMTYEDFTRFGKLGCGNCYNTFSSRLMPIFRKLHGNTKHTGKVPGKVNNENKTCSEINELRAELESLIRNEEYEEAAKRRDRIRYLEKKQKEGEGAN